MVRETYDLLDRLGTGRIATTHLARQRGGSRLVALKRLRRELVPRPELVERFLHQARVAKVCTHPNVVEIYNAGRSDEGYFIAMEYVEGPSLAELARTRPVPLHVALWLVRGLCIALDHVHTRTARGEPLDVVHRAVNPSNVIVTPRGQVKLIDFGAASTARFQPHARHLVGTSAHVAPEAIRGDRSDLRVDLYGVGATAWELLAGRPLFVDHSGAAVVEHALYGIAAPLSRWRSDVSPELDALVLSTLAKDPAQRPSSALLLRKQLDAVIRCTCVNASAVAVARWLAEAGPMRAAG